METLMTDTSPNTPPPVPSRWRNRGTLKIAGIVVISAIAGAAASRAGHHWHGHGMGHGFMSGPIDPASVDRGVDWMTGKLARDVNASDAQREKLSVIAKAAAKDLLPMRTTMQEARKQARELLAQPAVDRAAVEKLRADQIANLDTMSKRLSAAMTDAAEVLTPEQRKQLAERFPPHDGWRAWDKRS
jgi:periplasmic protein CpxP/Spy